jgi:pilus assembly protein CpaE
VLARAYGERRAAVEPAVGQVRTIVFLHASGGAGATTLAVNAAVQLRQRLKPEDGQVCLIDLDLQFGDADLHLDLPVRSRVGEIINAPERLDPRMLEDLMIDGPLGIRVLTAPETPAPLDALRPQTVEAILALARRRYRYVVVDMPLALTHWTETVLRAADQIFLVTQINVTALRAARRLLDAVKGDNGNKIPVAVIANRYGGKSSGPKIPLAQAAKALGAPIRVVAPSDYGLLVESLDQGVPASMLRPSAKFCASVAGALDKTVEHKTPEPPKGPAAFLKKFRR